MIRLNGADITIQLLERQGIEVIAGIPGGAILPIYDAMCRRNRIKHILTRNEQGAGFIAQGIARVNHKPAVCMATSGPGATNLLTAIADAKLDSIPVICITGQVASDLLGKDSFQEVDICAMSRPVTKASFFARSGAELLKIIPGAFRISMSGKPGPVLIDIPKDVQTTMVEFEEWPEPGMPDTPPCPNRIMIKEAADVINEAKRPVIYAGGGAARSGAWETVLHLAEKANIPVAMSLMGLGIIPPDHPLSMGMLGMHGSSHANRAMEECDLLIAIGARFDDRATGKVSHFCPRAEVIHIDIDPGELNKIKEARIGICGDAAAVLESLEPMVRKNKREVWLNRINTLRKTYRNLPEIRGNRSQPSEYISCIAGMLDSDALIVTDVGQHQMWIAQSFPFTRPGNLITSGGLGTMGFGIPTAIGAALAAPLKKVVCFTGDGSIMMNIQELATIAEQKIDVKIILFNNNALGLVRQQQELFYENRLYSSSYFHMPDFTGMAKAFGINSYDIAESDSPMKTLEQELNRKGTCLIHVPIDKNEKVFPMVPPGASNGEMIGEEKCSRSCIAA